MHQPALCLLAIMALLLPAGSGFLAGPAVGRSTVASRHGAAPAMALGLGRASPFGVPTPFGSLLGGSQQPEVLYESGTPVDFQMETLHLTKRRVSGGVLVRATPEAIWAVLTDYEAMPEVIPNILSNTVRRESSGRVLIDQQSLLSRRMGLEVHIQLEAVEQKDRWQLDLRRQSGHGFLELDAVYNLQPRGDGSTYLAYKVELVPCPLFPLPLVERKMRKEVPKMLHALRVAAERTQ